MSPSKGALKSALTGAWLVAGPKPFGGPPGPDAKAITVIPAEAGIQALQNHLDPGLRRGDDVW